LIVNRLTPEFNLLTSILFQGSCHILKELIRFQNFWGKKLPLKSLKSTLNETPVLVSFSN
jgi:hypothetical protein